jgi:hypothetical protein
MASLEWAVSAGVEKQQAIDEAERLLERLVRFARGGAAD